MKVFREFAETVIVAALIFVALQLATQTFRIVGPSMRPTLISGEYVLVNKVVYANAGRVARASAADEAVVERQYFFRAPQRGDVIVFHPPGGEEADFVKRIVGVPGDEVDIRDRHVYVNGKLVEEALETGPGNTLTYPVEVPPDQYFVLGDNRAQSNDSRAWGFARADQIIGRVMLRYWPISDLRLF
ncbi:MAG: signal peptidase I [SAR202 cluster bacterium]|nr:signal peptidase I [SAR202 cluster bacterium]